MKRTIPEIIIYSSGFCPYCIRALRLLKQKGVRYREIRVDFDQKRRLDMQRRSGRATVPQIFIGGRHIGGYDDMAALDRAGKLDPILGLEPDDLE